MEHEIDRIECAIRHIESALDVDPWACEIAVRAMQELIKRTRWIPVTERLPEVRQWVLCQCRANIMDVLRLTDDGGWYRKSNEIYMSGFVLAWMPLPPSYKGE